jgi:hypothetical protein
MCLVSRTRCSVLHAAPQSRDPRIQVHSGPRISSAPLRAAQRPGHAKPSSLRNGCAVIAGGARSCARLEGWPPVPWLHPSFETLAEFIIGPRFARTRWQAPQEEALPGSQSPRLRCLGALRQQRVPESSRHKLPHTLHRTAMLRSNRNEGWGRTSSTWGKSVGRPYAGDIGLNMERPCIPR